MRAARLNQILVLVVCLAALAGMGFAQAGSGQSTVVVLDTTGLPLADTTLVYEVDGGQRDIAANIGHGTFVLVGSDAKAKLFIENPAFGSVAVDVDLPAVDGALVTIYVDTETLQTKVLLFDGLRDIIRVAEAGSDVIPPPGQGCQLPDQLGHGSAGYVAVVSDRTSPFIAADCFKPQNDGFLTHAVWWGAYVNIVFGLGTDCSPGPGDDFVITYYEDNGSGLPGTVMASFPLGLAQKFQTGNLLMGFALEYQFQSDFHTPVPVTAGQCYWIEISNNTVGNADCFWLWSTAPPGDNASAQTDTGGVYRTRDYDLAYCVNLQIETDGCAGGASGPANDDCSNCEVISGEGTFAFDNTDATLDGPAHAACDFFGQQSIDHDLWYCWTAPCDATVLLETCNLTSVDTKIAVYDSTSCPPTDGALLACNDDNCSLQSGLTFSASSGATYLLRIGTYPGAMGGAGSFSLACQAGGPGNDDCANATAVSIGSTTSGATTLANPDAVATCTTSLNTAPGVWFSVTGNGNRLNASLCSVNTDYDTKIGVFCGGCNGLICVAGNDDSCGLQSEVEWDSSNGIEYLVLVTGFSSNSGNFELTLSDVGANQGTPVSCSAPLSTGLDILSTLNGVFLQVEPLDNFDLGAGLTPFTRVYDFGTQVTITAPTQWDGKDLLGWRLGNRVIRPHQGSVTGLVDIYREIVAIYKDHDQTQDGDILHR